MLSFRPLATLYTDPRLGCQCSFRCSASDKFKPSALSAAGTRPPVPAPSNQSPQIWPAPSLLVRPSRTVLPAEVLPFARQGSARRAEGFCPHAETMQNLFPGFWPAIALTLSHLTHTYIHFLHSLGGRHTFGAVLPRASATLPKGLPFCPDPKRSAGNTVPAEATMKKPCTGYHRKQRSCCTAGRNGRTH